MKISKKDILVITFALAAITLFLFLCYLYLSSQEEANWHRLQFLSERVEVDGGTFDGEANAILLNCTLLKGSSESTVCNLKEITIQDYRGTVASGIPVPSQLILNEKTTIRLNLNASLPSEIYFVQIRTANGTVFGYSLNVGNFADPQEQIEVKEIWYNSTENAVFAKCNRIEERTDLSVVIKDSQGGFVGRDMNPIRNQMDEGTMLKASLNQVLTPGQYSLYIVTGKGLIKQFTVP